MWLRWLNHGLSFVNPIFFENNEWTMRWPLIGHRLGVCARVWVFACLRFFFSLFLFWFVLLGFLRSRLMFTFYLNVFGLPIDSDIEYDGLGLSMCASWRGCETRFKTKSERTLGLKMCDKKWTGANWLNIKWFLNAQKVNRDRLRPTGTVWWPDYARPPNCQCF